MSLYTQLDLVEGVPNLCTKFTIHKPCSSEVTVGHEHLLAQSHSIPTTTASTLFQDPREWDVNIVPFHTFGRGGGKGPTGLGGHAVQTVSSINTFCKPYSRTKGKLTGHTKGIWIIQNSFGYL